MPRKNMNSTVTATIDEVIELHELGNLAQDWATEGPTFPEPLFNTYQELCRKYNIDAAALLRAYQVRNQFRNGEAFEVPAGPAGDGDDARTGIIEMPKIGSSEN